MILQSWDRIIMYMHIVLLPNEMFVITLFSFAFIVYNTYRLSRFAIVIYYHGSIYLSTQIFTFFYILFLHADQSCA